MTIQVLYSTLGGSGRTFSHGALDFIADPRRTDQILNSAEKVGVSPTAIAGAIARKGVKALIPMNIMAGHCC